MKSKDIKELTWYKPTIDTMYSFIQLCVLIKNSGKSIWLLKSGDVSPALFFRESMIKSEIQLIEEIKNPKIHYASKRAIMRKLFQ